MRVASVFAKRGYNIDALVVSPSVDPNYSRMTITAQGDPETLDQIIKQTAKLVDVIQSSEHTGVDAIHRELALVKIKNVPANKPVVSQLAKKHNATLLKEGKNAVIFQQAGTTEELDALESALKKYGIIEMVRSGKLVMTKGKEIT